MKKMFFSLIVMSLSLIAADEGAQAARTRELSMQLWQEVHDGNSLENATRLIDEGADVDFKRPYYETNILREAAAKPERLGLLNLLLERGASVKYEDQDRSPIHEAVGASNLEAVERLLQAGADINARMHNQATPLHLACLFLDNPMDTLQLLIAREATVDVVDDDGCTALHNIAIRGKPEAIHFIVGICCKLLEAKNTKGSTALHFAAQNGNEKAVIALLEEGGDRHAKDNDGKTPLDLALGHNQEKVAEILKEFTNASVRKAAVKS